MNTKQEAKEQAKAVLKRMNTGGWKACVWENNGWYWCLSNSNGHLTLYPAGVPSKFFCLLSGGYYKHSGSTNWSINKTYKDPNRAVSEQINKALAYIEKLNLHMSYVLNSLERKNKPK